MSAGTISEIRRKWNNVNLLTPYDVIVKDAGTVYKRWVDDDVNPVLIEKIVTTAGTGETIYTTTYANDLWANRETATYSPLIEA